MNEPENTPKCPICGQPVLYKNNPFRPFCSRRCKMIDLGAWLDGDYSIQGADKESEMDQDEDQNADESVNVKWRAGDDT